MVSPRLAPPTPERMEEIRSLAQNHRRNEIGRGWERADRLADALEELLRALDASAAKEAAPHA